MELLISVPVDVTITLIVNHVNSWCVFLLFALKLYCFQLLLLLSHNQSTCFRSRRVLRKTVAGDSTIRIKKFTGKNSFLLWKIKMKAQLKQ